MIAVQVCGEDSEWGTIQRVADLVHTKRAIPISGKAMDRESIVGSRFSHTIGPGDVKAAVAIEIPGHGIERETTRDVDGRPYVENTSAIIEVHRQHALTWMGGVAKNRCEIQLAVIPE